MAEKLVLRVGIYCIIMEMKCRGLVLCKIAAVLNLLPEGELGIVHQILKREHSSKSFSKLT